MASTGDSLNLASGKCMLHVSLYPNISLISFINYVNTYTLWGKKFTNTESYLFYRCQKSCRIIGKTP